MQSYSPAAVLIKFQLSWVGAERVGGGYLGVYFTLPGFTSEISNHIYMQQRMIQGTEILD